MSQANVVTVVIEFCLDQIHKRQEQVEFQISHHHNKYN